VLISYFNYLIIYPSYECYITAPFVGICEPYTETLPGLNGTSHSSKHYNFNVNRLFVTEDCRIMPINDECASVGYFSA